MRNMCNSLGFVIREKEGLKSYTLTSCFQKVMDDALIDISSGSFDFESTLRKCVNQMTQSGIRWIDYASGHHNRIEVAARRSLMSGMANIAVTNSHRAAQELGIDTFEVSAHTGARPTHALWQGKVYTSKELEEVCGKGTVTGLLGANCYHTYYPFFKGISQRTYTDDQ